MWPRISLAKNIVMIIVFLKIAKMYSWRKKTFIEFSVQIQAFTGYHVSISAIQNYDDK